MAKLSQKELINEGVFNNILRGVAKTALQTAKGAAKGTVKGAVKMITPTGYNLLASGANKAKQIGKNIKQNFVTKEDQLTDMLYQRGLMPVGEIRGNINKQGTVNVAVIDYDSQGNPKPGRAFSAPVVFSNKDGNITIVRGPYGSTTAA